LAWVAGRGADPDAGPFAKVNPPIPKASSGKQIVTGPASALAIALQGPLGQVEEIGRRLFVDVVEPESMGSSIPVLGGLTGKIRGRRRRWRVASRDRDQPRVL
jgi:hypothetical protein